MSEATNITAQSPGGAKVELGFELDAAAVEDLGESLRGKYDITRMQQRHPQMVSLITWLLSLPGMTHQAIADAAGISWESVAAIQAAKLKSIREFKLRTAERLGLVLEAALPGLMQRAAEGKLGALDFKLLTESWLQLSGEGHTVKFEGAPQEDPRRQRIRALLDASPMVFEAEVIPQMAPIPAALPPPPPSLRLLLVVFHHLDMTFKSLIYSELCFCYTGISIVLFCFLGGWGGGRWAAGSCDLIHS